MPESFNDLRPANKNPTAKLSLVAGAHPTRSRRAFVSRPGNSGGRNRTTSHHDEEELLFVLKGRIELRISKQLETLSAGDCVHFHSAIAHQLASIGATAASALVVASETSPKRRVRSNGMSADCLT